MTSAEESGGPVGEAHTETWVLVRVPVLTLSGGVKEGSGEETHLTLTPLSFLHKPKGSCISI